MSANQSSLTSSPDVPRTMLDKGKGRAIDQSSPADETRPIPDIDESAPPEIDELARSQSLLQLGESSRQGAVQAIDGNDGAERARDKPMDQDEMTLAKRVKYQGRAARRRTGGTSVSDLLETIR